MDNSSPSLQQQEPTYLEPTVIMMRLTPAQSARMFPRRNNDPRLDRTGRRLRRRNEYMYSYPYMPPSRGLDYDYGEPTVVIPKLNLPPGVEQPRDLVHLVYKSTPILPPTAAEELQLPMQDGATKIVCLTNMLPGSHQRSLLADDDFYDRFVDDVEVEACEYGRLVKLVVPRPNDGVHPDGAVGKVFLQYACLDGANVCQAMMNRCLWKGGEEIVARFYPEDRFAAGDYMALDNKLVSPDDRNPTRRSPVLSPNYQRRVASVPGKKLTRLDPF